MEPYLWPIIFNQPNLNLKESDILNFASTSKSYYQLFLEAKKNQESSKIECFFKFFTSHQMMDMRDIVHLKSFDSCITFFDIELEKIKKSVRIFHLLNGLNDECKILILNSQVKVLALPFFSRILKHLVTEKEVYELVEKIRKMVPNITKRDKLIRLNSYRKIIHLMVVNGQLTKALDLIKKDDLDIKMSKIVKNLEIYTFLHAPFLNGFERLKLTRDFFEKSVFRDFRKKTIKACVMDITSRIDNQNEPCVNALLFYFKYATIDFLKEYNKDRLIILKKSLNSKIIIKTLNTDKDFFNIEFDNIYKRFLLCKIDEFIKNKNFELALKYAKTLPYGHSTEIIKIYESHIYRLIQNQEFQTAFEIANKNPYPHSRNIQLVEIAEHAIYCNQLDMALTITSSISLRINTSHRQEDNEVFIADKDSLYYQIAKKQNLNVGSETFKQIRYKEKYLTGYFINIAEIIDINDISDTLDMICDLDNRHISLQTLCGIAQRLFPDYFANDWIKYGNQINSNTKRRVFLGLLFASLQRNESSILFNEGTTFYSSILESIEKLQFENMIDTICNLPSKWELNFVLFAVTDHFFPNKDLSKWAKNSLKFDDISEKTRFFNSFATCMQILQDHKSAVSFTANLLEVTNGNISSALDIANAYPIENTRFKLFLQISKSKLNQETKDHLKTCNEVGSHLERRKLIHDLIGL